MAERAAVRSSPGGRWNIEQVFWEQVTNSDTGEGYAAAGLAPLFGSVQFVGTIGTAITLQESNDGTNWVTMKDTNGTDISTGTSGAIFQFSTASLYIRPGTPTGTSDVDVTVILRNQ